MDSHRSGFAGRCCIVLIGLCYGTVLSGCMIVTQDMPKEDGCNRVTIRGMILVDACKESDIKEEEVDANINE